jgi:hypothetical protein
LAFTVLETDRFPERLTIDARATENPSATG